MSTTYTVRVKCDERTSPECLEEAVETLTEPRLIDALWGRRWQEGWRQGWYTDGTAATFDCCPACAPSLERRLEGYGRRAET